MRPNPTPIQATVIRRTPAPPGRGLTAPPAPAPMTGTTPAPMTSVVAPTPAAHDKQPFGQTTQRTNAQTTIARAPTQPTRHANAPRRTHSDRATGPQYIAVHQAADPVQRTPTHTDTSTPHASTTPLGATDVPAPTRRAIALAPLRGGFDPNRAPVSTNAPAPTNTQAPTVGAATPCVQTGAHSLLLF